MGGLTSYRSLAAEDCPSTRCECIGARSIHRMLGRLHSPILTAPPVHSRPVNRPPGLGKRSRNPRTREALAVPTPPWQSLVRLGGVVGSCVYGVLQHSLFGIHGTDFRLIFAP